MYTLLWVMLFYFTSFLQLQLFSFLCIFFPKMSNHCLARITVNSMLVITNIRLHRPTTLIHCSSHGL